MAIKNGQMLTCDRCGAWIFRRCTGEGQSDGGYTRWNNFETADGWEFIDGVGNVCPKCYGEYLRILDDFRKPPAKVKGVG